MAITITKCPECKRKYDTSKYDECPACNSTAIAPKKDDFEILKEHSSVLFLTLIFTALGAEFNFIATPEEGEFYFFVICAILLFPKLHLASYSGFLLKVWVWVWWIIYFSIPLSSIYNYFN